MTVDKHTLDQAKKWADRVKSFDHGQMEGNAPAAAEVILSLPDVIVDGDKLREWIEGMKVSDQPGGAQALLDYLKRDFLPTPAPQVEIKLGAWAMHPKHGKVLITSARVDSDGEVRVHVKDSSSAVGTAPAWVTAADLSPLPDTHDDSAPDQGANCQGPLNSSSEPQPGEAWLIRTASGECREAVLDSEGDWNGTYDNGECHVWWKNVTPLRRLVPAQEPRVLTTVEDYENAAVGTIAQAVHGIPREKLDDDEWGAVGSIRLLNNEEMAFSARTVLWGPEA